MRLDKLLANSGLGSRKDVKKMIRRGQVEVNGAIITDPSNHIDEDKDEILIDGRPVDYKEYRYVLLNKPDGVVSATSDKHETTVIDILPEFYRTFDLFPVGRLDKDTEGLLLLTDDGKLAHRLLSPKHHVPKTYYAVISGKVTDEVANKLRQGVTLDDEYQTMPAEVDVLESGRESEVLLTIYEGKFHQIKRMFEAVGLKVTYLMRTEMGPLSLDPDLAPGAVRELSEEEEKELKEAAWES